MFAADQGNALAETVPVHPDQHIAVGVLDLSHVLEDLRRLRIGGAQLIGIGEIDAGIVFFGGNGESEDLLLRKAVEAALAAEARKTEHVDYHQN